MNYFSRSIYKYSNSQNDLKVFKFIKGFLCFLNYFSPNIIYKCRYSALWNSQHIELTVNQVHSVVDFKSLYNKTKISEMDISNIYLKKRKF